LIWECSDLIYFLFVIMSKEGISIKDIEKENEKRNKDVIK
jgi:phosphoribosyl-ATP pyrophosphohydrolase